jgi:hypothetical protein
MRVKSAIEKMFDNLSMQAKLKIKLDRAESDQEKFILYVEYASLIAEEEELERLENSIFGETTENQARKNFKKIVIDSIKWYLDKEKMSPNTMSKKCGYDVIFVPVLNYAVSCPEVVDLLLARGANPNLQSDSGNTPLHEISKMLPSFYTDQLLKSTALLVSAGADSNLKNKDNKIPCDLVTNTIALKDQFIRATEPSFATAVRESFGGTSELLYPCEEQPVLPLSEEDLAQIHEYNQLLKSKVQLKKKPDEAPEAMLSRKAVMQRLVSSNEDRPADNLDNPPISLGKPSGVIEYSSDCYSNSDYVELEIEEPFRVFPPLFLSVSPVALETQKNNVCFDVAKFLTALELDSASQEGIEFLQLSADVFPHLIFPIDYKAEKINALEKTLIAKGIDYKVHEPFSLNGIAIHGFLIVLKASPSELMALAEQQENVRRLSC